MTNRSQKKRGGRAETDMGSSAANGRRHSLLPGRLGEGSVAGHTDRLRPPRRGFRPTIGRRPLPSHSIARHVSEPAFPLEPASVSRSPHSHSIASANHKTLVSWEFSIVFLRIVRQRIRQISSAYDSKGEFDQANRSSLSWTIDTDRTIFILDLGDALSKRATKDTVSAYSRRLHETALLVFFPATAWTGFIAANLVIFLCCGHSLPP